MPATIKEIASYLGLNPSTVSRALSGSPEVSEATRQKVIQYAGEINYSPNLLAKSLVGAARNLIGCLVLEYTNPFFIPMIRAIEEWLGQHDYILFFSESQRDQELEKKVIERYRQIRSAGIILTPVLQDVSHLAAVKKEGTPVVIVGRCSPDFDCVDLNNTRAGTLVGRHLLSLGHTKIGYLFSGEAYNIPEKERLGGLQQAFVESGHGLARLYSVGNNRMEGGERAGELWLAERNRPTAIFCANDLLAMGLIHSLTQAGVRIPGDLAVVGHDDIPFANLFSVPLTTIAFPKSEMGSIAAQILLERLVEEHRYGEPQHVVLEPQLIVRSSCGAG